MAPVKTVVSNFAPPAGEVYTLPSFYSYPFLCRLELAGQTSRNKVLEKIAKKYFKDKN